MDENARHYELCVMNGQCDKTEIYEYCDGNEKNANA